MLLIPYQSFSNKKLIASTFLQIQCNLILIALVKVLYYITIDYIYSIGSCINELFK